MRKHITVPYKTNASTCLIYALESQSEELRNRFGILRREISSTTYCPTKNSCDFEKLVLCLSRMIASYAAKEENSCTSPYTLRHAIKVPYQSYRFSSNIRDIHSYVLVTWLIKCEWVFKENETRWLQPCDVNYEMSFLRRCEGR
ncbi:hypothetical protein TIFTF001_043706 [Ficus carica]|uniref:Uncharacterized protein n=1 Tax=Ficus carica TaxID=3494 RepID=A0AA88CNN5_FICCA|nr:hypothetical protein TIFTF001_043706 [Ficus carica]